MSIRVAALVSISLALVARSPIALADRQPVQQPQASVTCELFEVWGTHEKAPSMDSKIPTWLAKRLTNDLKQNAFKLLWSDTNKKLDKKKPEKLKLVKGSATVTFVEIVDNTKIRLNTSLTMAPGPNGKPQIVNADPIFAAGDSHMAVVKTLSKEPAEAHIFALTCK